MQREATAIGHDARGVDGRIGPGTLGAVAAFTEAAGLRDVPELADDTAWLR